MGEQRPIENNGKIVAVMAAIRARIGARQLVPGARLPSIRGFAGSMGVSTFTVAEAYERLAGEGVIRSRPGSGFYVAAALAPLTLAEIGPKLDREIDPLWISRQALEAGDEVLKPGCGWLPPAWMPQEAIRRGLRTLSRGDLAALVDYGPPLGLPDLRELLARRIGQQGVALSPDRVMLTDSGTQAIDLLCRFLIEPGDRVLVDDPCYFNFHALLRAHRAEVLSVPYTPDGPDIDRFAEIVETRRPRLYVTNSGVHNPTGATLSAVAAHRLLKLAEQADLTIIEDDIFADFEESPAPRLAAFDGLERVVQIGSFSKTLSASVRCGFIAARRDWIEGLSDLRVATSFAPSRLSAHLVLNLLTDGGYRKHVETLRLRLSRARAEALRRLKAVGLQPWIEPRAGMFLWCRLPGPVNALDLARRALEAGIVLAPGNAFSLAQTAGHFLRFNVAQTTDPRIFEFLDSSLRL